MYHFFRECRTKASCKDIRDTKSKTVEFLGYRSYTAYTRLYQKNVLKMYCFFFFLRQCFPGHINM